MGSVTGIPEITLISPSSIPNPCSASTASAAGSISPNNASRVFVSFIPASSFQLTNRLDGRLANLHQAVSHLPFLNFPDWNQRNDLGCHHIQKNKECESTKIQPDLNTRYV